MTHDAIRETYPSAVKILGVYPNLECYDADGNKLNLDLSAVSSKSTEETLNEFKDIVQKHLDKTANDWGYDNIYTAIGYIGDPHIEFDLEGQMFRNWRSAVWVYVNQELAKLQQGLRTIPTESEAIAELPLLDTYRTQLGL